MLRDTRDSATARRQSLSTSCARRYRCTSPAAAGAVPLSASKTSARRCSTEAPRNGTTSV